MRPEVPRKALGSGAVFRSEVCRAVSSNLLMEKEKQNPFPGRRVIYSREGNWRGAQGSPSAWQSFRKGP